MKKKVLWMLLITMLLITGCSNKAASSRNEAQEASVTVEQEAAPDAAKQEKKEVSEKPETTEASKEQKDVAKAENTKTEAPKQESAAKTEKTESSVKDDTTAKTEKIDTTAKAENTSKAEESQKQEKQPKTEESKQEAPHTCSWDGGSVTETATCNSEGTMTYTCNGCGATRSESIPQTSHNFVTQTTEATCTAAGSSVDVCTICGTSQPGSSSGSPLGHDFQKNYPNGEATCSCYGYWTMTCTRCGESGGSGTDPSLPHNPVGETTQVGDCVVPTVIQYTCSDCGVNCGMDSFTTDDHVWETKPSAPVWDEATQSLVPGPDVTECARCGQPG